MMRLTASLYILHQIPKGTSNLLFWHEPNELCPSKYKLLWRVIEVLYSSTLKKLSSAVQRL